VHACPRAKSNKQANKNKTSSKKKSEKRWGCACLVAFLVRPTRKKARPKNEIVASLLPLIFEKDKRELHRATLKNKKTTPAFALLANKLPGV